MTHDRLPRLSRYWLLIGVGALAIAGLYALVLVVARAPSVAELPMFSGLFHQALAVHVDLSVLVWFLSMACLMWSFASAGARPLLPWMEEAALICFGLGTLAITCSPLSGGVALMSNYIPVVASPLFFLGLALLLCGVLLMLGKLFFSLPLQGGGPGWGLGLGSECSTSPHLTSPRPGEGLLRFGIFSSGLIALIAVMAFVWSYWLTPHVLEGQDYYDLMFWGGGHVLQLAHVQVMMVCWLLLSRRRPGSTAQLDASGEVDPGLRRDDKLLYMLFAIGLIAACATPLAYLLYPVDAPEHRLFFTQMMMVANGVAPAMLGILILIRHSRAGGNPCLTARASGRAWIPACAGMTAQGTALFMSILLFLYGGLLGGMIRGQNVVIPAHYHGSIVGVTLAFMGVAYWLLPRFGRRDVSGWRMAFWQPVVYGGGQLLHVSGLAWSGGYGVLRKTPGGLDALPASVKAAMGVMGLGGLIAIIGGFMFVIVVARAIWPQRAAV